jgi:hypothetical protein
MAKSLSYEEILARRDKRKRQEHAQATKRPPIPHSRDIAWTIMILQWTIDELFKQWKAIELAKAQDRKIVLPPKGAPKRGRGGRRNPVFEALGLD